MPLYIIAGSTRTTHGTIQAITEVYSRKREATARFEQFASETANDQTALAACFTLYLTTFSGDNPRLMVYQTDTRPCAVIVGGEAIAQYTKEEPPYTLPELFPVCAMGCGNVVPVTGEVCPECQEDADEAATKEYL